MNRRGTSEAASRPSPGFGRLHLIGPVLLVVLLAVSCTESDPQLLAEIGVTRLFLIDPDLDHPTVQDLQQFGIDPPVTPMQVAEWKVLSADLEIGDAFVDLLVEPGCRFTDTSEVTPVADGPCTSGIVIESSEDAMEVVLSLEVELRVRRAEPTKILLVGDLWPDADFDGDGTPNDGDGDGTAFNAPCGKGGAQFNCDDNCPLIPNEGQDDGNEDGIGDACAIGSIRDSDGDGVADSADNCLWEYNPTQANTQGSSVDGTLIPDGIGDACVEQTALVAVGGEQKFHLMLGPAGLAQPFFGHSFITADFSDDSWLESCRWDSGACTLDAELVKFCAPTSGAVALLGCPDGS